MFMKHALGKLVVDHYLVGTKSDRTYNGVVICCDRIRTCVKSKYQFLLSFFFEPIAILVFPITVTLLMAASINLVFDVNYMNIYSYSVVTFIVLELAALFACVYIKCSLISYLRYLNDIQAGLKQCLSKLSLYK